MLKLETNSNFKFQERQDTKRKVIEEKANKNASGTSKTKKKNLGKSGHSRFSKAGTKMPPRGIEPPTFPMAENYATTRPNQLLRLTLSIAIRRNKHQTTDRTTDDGRRTTDDGHRTLLHPQMPLSQKKFQISTPRKFHYAEPWVASFPTDGP